MHNLRLDTICINKPLHKWQHGQIHPTPKLLCSYMPYSAWSVYAVVHMGWKLPCQLDRICDHQILTTNRVVDDTVYFSTSAPSWTQTNMVDKHKFLASEPDFSNSQKTQFLPTPPAFGTPVGDDPIGISYRSFAEWTWVPGLSCSPVFPILHLVGLWQMDGRKCDDSKYHASIASCGQKGMTPLSYVLVIFLKKS